MSFCCCLCCPLFRLVLWLCALEFLSSLYIWYNLVDHCVKTLDALQFHDILLLIILSGWLITLSVSSISLYVAERRKDSDLALPRLVQLSGLLICGLIGSLVLILYFSGASTSIENALIDGYEYAFAAEPLTSEDREEAHAAIRLYFIALIPVNFVFVCYEAIALALTCRYWRQLRDLGRTTASTVGKGFQLVAAEDPSPPPPKNPNWRGSFA